MTFYWLNIYCHWDCIQLFTLMNPLGCNLASRINDTFQLIRLIGYYFRKLYQLAGDCEEIIRKPWLSDFLKISIVLKLTLIDLNPLCWSVPKWIREKEISWIALFTVKYSNSRRTSMSLNLLPPSTLIYPSLKSQLTIS